MALRLAVESVRQAAAGGFEVLWISGGESFLCFPELCALIEVAAESRLSVVINSNGYWATSINEAKSVLSTLLKHGSFSLALSTDSFHVPFVDLKNVEYAAIAAQELSIARWLGIVTFRGDESLEIIEGRAEKIGLEAVVQPLQYVGRAARLHQSLHADDPNVSQGCYSSIVPTVLPNGDVTICCAGASHRNARFFLGNLNDARLIDLLNREASDPLFNLLRVCGPSFLYRALKEAAANLVAQRHLRFNSKCQLCYDLCRIPQLDEMIAQLNDNLLQKLICLDVCNRRGRAESPGQKGAAHKDWI